MSSYDSELVIVGAGPAGLSAAVAAARLGVRTLVLDENQRPGGQLFKQIHKFFGSHQHSAGIRGFRIGEQLLSDIQKLDVRVLLDTVAFGFFGENTIGAYGGGKVFQLKGEKVILATGATEKPLRFGGWTLPGVMGAGAVQTMMNLHGVLPGTRVLTIGSGNVGLIVSYQLIQAGARVVALVEALPQISGWHVHAAKLRRLGVPIHLSHTIVEARGTDCVEQAVIGEINERCEFLEKTIQTLDVDLVCVAVGLRPLTELAELAGCRMDFISPLGGFLPLHDNAMKSSCPHVYVAGDLTGIEEASTAMEEGKLAGVSAARALGKIDEAAFRRMAGEIHESLKELRLGSFGEERRKCKEKIVAELGEPPGGGT
jgi:thioredoxin reductase